MKTLAAPEPTDSAPRPAAALLAELAALTPVIRDHGAAADQAGAVPDVVLDAVHATQVTGAMTPREFGGAELRPTELLTVTRTLAQADPSIGWVIQAYIFLKGLAGVFLERDVATELFRTPRLAMARPGNQAGPGRPQGGRLRPQRPVELRLGRPARDTRPYGGTDLGHRRGTVLLRPS